MFGLAIFEVARTRAANDFLELAAGFLLDPMQSFVQPMGRFALPANVAGKFATGGDQQHHTKGQQRYTCGQGSPHGQKAQNDAEGGQKYAEALDQRRIRLFASYRSCTLNHIGDSWITQGQQTKRKYADPKDGVLPRLNISNNKA